MPLKMIFCLDYFQIVNPVKLQYAVLIPDSSFSNCENRFPDSAAELVVRPLHLVKRFSMCEFQYLFYSGDGYVVRCRECGHFQLAFCSMVITLTDQQFYGLRDVVHNQLQKSDTTMHTPHVKSVLLQTPAAGVRIMLSYNETETLMRMLEEADSEYKSQALISMLSLGI